MPNSGFASPLCYVANGEADVNELRSPVVARTNERTNATNERVQDSSEKSCVPDAPNPVENEVEVAVSRADVLRTRVALAGLQARQDRLRDGLSRSGLTSTADRLDFLIAQRSPDEALAWSRHWRALGVTRPDPTGEVFLRPESLSVPLTPRRRRRKRVESVIAPDRQLEIAIAALATQEAREGRLEKAA